MQCTGVIGLTYVNRYTAAEYPPLKVGRYVQTIRTAVTEVKPFLAPVGSRSLVVEVH